MQTIDTIQLFSTTMHSKQQSTSCLWEKYKKVDVEEFLMGQFGLTPLLKSAPFLVFLNARFLGNGLVTDRDYEHWHKQRKVMDPAFSRR